MIQALGWRKTLAVLIAAAFSSAVAAQANEREAIAAFLPKGWVVAADDSNATGSVFVMVPPGQRAERWTRRAAIRVQRATHGLTLEQFGAFVALKNRRSCTNFSLRNVIPPYRDRAYLQVHICGQVKGTNFGEVYIVRAMKGVYGHYFVSRSWRTQVFFPPRTLTVSEDDIVKSLLILQAARICRFTPPAPAKCSANTFGLVAWSDHVLRIVEGTYPKKN